MSEFVTDYDETDRPGADIDGVGYDSAGYDAGATAWTARAMLPGDDQAPRAARRLLATLMLAWGVPENVELAELVVTELVSNAVRHAGGDGDLELEVDLRGDVLHVAVADGSPVHPVMRGRDSDRPGGLGLHLIDRVCLNWGTQDYLLGKRVWVELPTERRHPAESA